jgi:hypothetical protein
VRLFPLAAFSFADYIFLWWSNLVIPCKLDYNKSHLGCFRFIGVILFIYYFCLCCNNTLFLIVFIFFSFFWNCESLKDFVRFLELGVAPSQGLYLHRTTQKKPHIYTSSRFRTRDPVVQSSKTVCDFYCVANPVDSSDSCLAKFILVILFVCLSDCKVKLSRVRS